MSGKFILLVEDNEDHALLAVRALKRHGAVETVEVVHDGAEALDFLFAAGNFAGRDASHLPVAILLDLKLPKLGGLEVLQRLRGDQRTRLLPVVVLTSSDEPRDLVQCYSLGANSYVRKPVDYVAFAEAARQLGLYWADLNQAPPAH